MTTSSSVYSGDLADEQTTHAYSQSYYDMPQTQQNQNGNWQTYGDASDDEKYIGRALTSSSKRYGDLRPADAGVKVGNGGRQVSTGNDLGVKKGNTYRRDVSGKIAEEGRGGVWGLGLAR
jgi:murein L,D-transpeptidase YcbB/YkuD